MKTQAASNLLWVVVIAFLSACHTPDQSKETAQLPDFSIVKPLPAAPTVVYIHGWQILQQKKHIAELARRKRSVQKSLNDAFPGSPILWLEWNSAIPWNQSLALSNEISEQFAKLLISLPEKKRENIIVVGHSIGCDIAVTAVALLQDYNGKIKQLILLGAAVSSDSDTVTKAIHGSADPAVILFCPEDGMLRCLMSWTENNPTLGAFGYNGPAQKGIDYVQYECPPSFPPEKWMYNHWSAYYMVHLKKMLKMNQAERRKMEIYPSSIKELSKMDPHFCHECATYQGNAIFPWMWITEKSKHGIVLQYSRFNETYARILCNDCLIYEGTPDDALSLFDRVTKGNNSK